MPPGFLMWHLNRKSMPPGFTYTRAEPNVVAGIGNVVVYSGPKPPTVAGTQNLVVTSKNLTRAQFDRIAWVFMSGALGTKNFVLGTDGLSPEQVDEALAKIGEVS